MKRLKIIVLVITIVCSLLWIMFILLLPISIQDKKQANIINKVEVIDSIFTDIRIENKIIDLGNVPIDSTIYGFFTIRNIGKETLFIRKVNPDCSCTSFTINRMVAKPTEEILLMLKVDTHHKIGDNIINVLLHANTKEKYHILKLKFNVLKNVDEENAFLHLDQKVVDLGDIPLGGERVFNLYATNISDKSIVILDAFTTCDCTKVICSKKPIKPKEKMVLTLTFSADYPGIFYKKIGILHSESPNPVSIAIKGSVLSSTINY